MKKIEIFSIGTELIYFNKIDTNSIWLIDKLHQIGYSVLAKHTLPDDKETIKKFIIQELDYADIIITIGGMGPTHDDVTTKAISEALNKKLILNQEILLHIEKRYKELKMTPSESIKTQAYIPENSDYFFNKYGTAPGIWLPYKDKIIIMLPGPPNEFIYVAESYIIPKLKQLQPDIAYLKLYFATLGLPESKIEELLQPFYKNHPNIDVTLLASPLQVEIYISIPKDYSKISSLEDINNEIYSLIGEYIYSNEEEKSLEHVIGELLLKHNKTISIAESCTGGKLADRITNISGSSKYFERGVVSYSNNSKIELLGVQPYLIDSYGAVSKEVAIAMAEGIRIKSKTDIGIAITGIAGPTGETEYKPIGTVHIALNSIDTLIHQSYIFKGDRKTIKFASTQAACYILWQYLKNLPN